jgi:hypothetical protein
MIDELNIVCYFSVCCFQHAKYRYGEMCRVCTGSVSRGCKQLATRAHISFAKVRVWCVSGSAQRKEKELPPRKGKKRNYHKVIAPGDTQIACVVSKTSL